MQKRNLAVVFFLIEAFTLNASIPDRPVGGQGAALGFTWISLNSGWSSLQNQAALAWQDKYWVGAHHENRFLVNELGLSAIGAVIPAFKGSFGVNVSHFGYSQFNITRAGVSYGMKLSPRFSAGVGFNVHHMQVAGDYREKDAYTVEGGLLYMPVKGVAIGAYIFNPTQSSLDGEESLPQQFGVGITYLPNEKLTLVIQVDDDTESKPAARGGVEYKALDNLAFRLGYSSGNPEGLTGGFGFNVKAIQVDLSFGYHRILGYTPQLSVSYQFGSKKAEQP